MSNISPELLDKIKKSIIVSGSGPLDAKIAGFGEAPAREEVAHQPKPEPFVGSAGSYLTKFCRLAGLDRSTIRLDNLSQRRVPGDKMKNLTYSELCYWREDMIRRINELPDVKVLIAFGNYTLETITGRSGIMKFRGSPMHPVPEIKHDCVVIPTVHPSSVHYNYEVWPYIVADLTKVNRIRQNDFNFKFPTYNFELNPSFNQIMARLDWFEKHLDLMYTVDVETPHGILSCFGIAWSRSDAICIPLIKGNGSSIWSLQQEMQLFRRLAEVMPKMNLNNQNFMFDWEVLMRHGIHLTIPKWDPMLMHHCLYSDLSHKLNDITSIYTDIEYYKEDEREASGPRKGSALFAGKELDHWKYNALDCVAAWWSIDELILELEEENMMDVYNRLYVNLFKPLLDMNMRGVRVDVNKLKIHRTDLESKNEQILKQLATSAGRDVNPNSTKDVPKLLYSDMGMEPYKTHGKVSSNEKNLRKLAHKYQVDEPLLIIEFRQNRREMSLFSEENIVNSRLHTQFSLGRAATGRLSSRKDVGGRGMNLQNVKRGEQRKFFLPEDGCLLVGADQKQADARCVAWLSRDPKMCRVIESDSIHLANSENIFGQRITKDDPRYHLAKSLVHAGNYGIGFFEFARNINKPNAEAKMLLELYHRTYPGIKDTFHKFVQDEIQKCRMLHNPLGRRQVYFGRIDNETYKKGYAFIPQSTVGDINKLALAFMDKHFGLKYIPFLELHDGLYFSVPPNDVKGAKEALIEAYSTEFEIWGEKHTIPIDISVGENWYEMKEIS